MLSPLDMLLYSASSDEMIHSSAALSEHTVPSSIVAIP